MTMNQNDLVKILKPIVKQLVREAIQQELAPVITEIIKQTSNNKVVERFVPSEPRQTVIPESLQKERLQEKQKLSEERKRTLEDMSKKSYGGINIFEGTTPLGSAGNPEQQPSAAMADPLAGTDPNDPGVDIGGILRMTGGWKLK
jgi:hypothetical protein